MIQAKTWILVADGGVAIVYRNTGEENSHMSRLVLVAGGLFKRESARRYPDARPGGGISSPATGIHYGVTTHERQERGDEEDFVTEVLAWLVSPSNMEQFDHLIVAAPPRSLGLLRRHMPKKLSNKISHEIHADLTKVPIKEIAQRVFSHLKPVLNRALP